MRLIALAAALLMANTVLGQSILTPGPNPTEADIQALFDQAVATKVPVVLPPGTFVGNWTITNAKGISIKGASREATVLMSKDKTKPTLDFRGLWYSTIADLSIGTKVGQDYEVLKVDKSPQQGVQGNRFENLQIGGQGTDNGVRSRYVFTMCREGTGSAQGSEQMFINCHLSGAREACYYQIGFNALNNIFLGGNFQNYEKDAIHLTAGSLQVINVGFQSTHGGRQVTNGGWDIACYEAGAIDTILVMGCRTESLQFCKSAWSQPVTIIGCSQRIATPLWYANVSYKTGDGVMKDGKLWIAKEDHTLPAWDASKWTETVWYSVYADDGRVLDSRWDGQVYQKKAPDINYREVSSTTTLSESDRIVAVSAKNNSVDINLANPYVIPQGTRVTIKRVDSSPFVVNVKSNWINDAYHSVGISSRSSVTFYVAGGGNFTRRWYCDE